MYPIILSMLKCMRLLCSIPINLRRRGKLEQRAIACISRHAEVWRQCYRCIGRFCAILCSVKLSYVATCVSQRLQAALRCCKANAKINRKWKIRPYVEYHSPWNFSSKLCTRGWRPPSWKSPHRNSAENGPIRMKLFRWYRQELIRRWDTRTWRDVSPSLFTYLPLNYDRLVGILPEYF